MRKDTTKLDDDYGDEEEDDEEKAVAENRNAMKSALKIIEHLSPGKRLQ